MLPICATFQGDDFIIDYFEEKKNIYTCGYHYRLNNIIVYMVVVMCFFFKIINDTFLDFF